jgi:hypothetical protein
MAKQDEDAAIGFRVSAALKKRAEERATSCGLSLSDYLKGLIAADVHGAQSFYSQRAAMNSHMTLMMVAALLKREGGDKALLDMWGPMEETVIGTYGPFAPMPAELMASLRGSKKPFFLQLYNFFRHHAIELKNGK